jgi:hypothetical protein
MAFDALHLADLIKGSTQAPVLIIDILILYYRLSAFCEFSPAMILKPPLWMNTLCYDSC